jgi:hypothetical protein
MRALARGAETEMQLAAAEALVAAFLREPRPDRPEGPDR